MRTKIQILIDIFITWEFISSSENRCFISFSNCVWESGGPQFRFGWFWLHTFGYTFFRRHQLISIGLKLLKLLNRPFLLREITLLNLSYLILHLLPLASILLLLDFPPILLLSLLRLLFRSQKLQNWVFFCLGFFGLTFFFFDFGGDFF